MAKKKSARKKLKLKLDGLVKKYVKLRDNYTCRKCKKEVRGSNCHGSHIIPVSADGRLAFYHQNIKVLCYRCHMNWWHKNPTEAGKWYAETYPENLEFLEKKRLEHLSLGSIPTAFFEEKMEEINLLLSEL